MITYFLTTCGLDFKSEDWLNDWIKTILLGGAVFVFDLTVLALSIALFFKLSFMEWILIVLGLYVISALIFLKIKTYLK
jgi:hypothetical protein